MTVGVGARTGGHLVVESLTALGATAAFGLPGIHALPIWEALRSSGIRAYGLRTELNAGFAAAGFALVTGRPAPVIVSTGPGALNSLTAVMEAASSHLPVVVIATQVPTDMIGRGRGYLHELADQRASFAPIVKCTPQARTGEEIPELIRQAWVSSLTPPSGPTYVEIPYDILKDAAQTPAVTALDGLPAQPSPPPAPALAEAAALLSSLPDPVIWAGGGVLRSGAWKELAQFAERLDAPVATTYMGKGSFPADHPLSAGSACDDAALRELIGGAGVVLAVGTELGAETTAQYSLQFSGRLIQVDADRSRIGATYPALGLVGDAKATLSELIALVPEQRDKGRGSQRASAVRERIDAGLSAQGRDLELTLLHSIRAGLPRNAITAFDMTILGYWAGPHFPVIEPRTFLYPLGSGTLGYAWPATLGAKVASPDAPALAVVGDGGFMYGMSELASARQHGLAAKLLLIDDGGYGILREYQREAYGAVHGVDLTQPDFMSLIEASGVPVRMTSRERIHADLGWLLETGGPAALVLRERLVSAAPTA